MFLFLQLEEKSASGVLNFELRIPCSVFLTATPLSSDQFAELLSSQTLNSNFKLSFEDINLSQVSAVLVNRFI